MPETNFTELIKELAKIHNVHCIEPVYINDTVLLHAVIIECYSQTIQDAFMYEIDERFGGTTVTTPFFGYKLIVTNELKKDN